MALCVFVDCRRSAVKRPGRYALIFGLTETQTSLRRQRGWCDEAFVIHLFFLTAAVNVLRKQFLHHGLYNEKWNVVTGSVLVRYSTHILNEFFSFPLSRTVLAGSEKGVAVDDGANIKEKHASCSYVGNARVGIL